jgi:hypothetical protein
MQTNLVPFVVLWALMAAAVLALVVWRKVVASKEDDNIHVLDGGSASISQQTVVAQKLDQIDKWGKTLTVITVVFGLVLAAAFVYQGWMNGSKIVE